MNKNLTEIIFILDRSGSMGGLERDTIGGFNSFINKQSEFEGETISTVVLFDNMYEILWDGVNIKNVKLTEKEYFVSGSTALLYAVGKTILSVGQRLSCTEERKRPGKVIFVITTDGMENSSVEFSYEKVKELIGHQQDKYNWEFIFLGANIDVAKEADSLGIQDSYSYQATSAGVADMYSVVCEAVRKYRIE